MLEANLEANDNSKRVVAKAKMPSQKRLMPLSIMVFDTISAVSRFRIDSYVHTPQGPAKALQTMPGYQNQQC